MLSLANAKPQALVPHLLLGIGVLFSTYKYQKG
jgi:hypothetical protein